MHDLDKEIDFDIDPLDIGLAKIQYQLIKKNNLNSTITETFENQNPMLDLSLIEIIYDSQKLEIIVHNKTKTNQYKHTLINGSKLEIVEYLSSKKFFINCKNFIYSISK